MKVNSVEIHKMITNIDGSGKTEDITHQIMGEILAINNLDIIQEEKLLKQQIY